MLALPPLDTCLMQSLMPRMFVFGVGMDAPSRYRTSMASVNSSFLRRSGVRNADANALSTDPPAGGVVDPVILTAGPPESTSDGPAQANSPALRRRKCQISVTEPPAASIFSLAASENLFAVISSL